MEGFTRRAVSTTEHAWLARLVLASLRVPARRPDGQWELTSAPLLPRRFVRVWTGRKPPQLKKRFWACGATFGGDRVWPRMGAISLQPAGPNHKV